LKKSFIAIRGAFGSICFCDEEEEESDWQPLKEFIIRNATITKEKVCRSDVDFRERMSKVCFVKKETMKV